MGRNFLLLEQVTIFPACSGTFILLLLSLRVHCIETVLMSPTSPCCQLIVTVSANSCHLSPNMITVDTLYVDLT